MHTTVQLVLGLSPFEVETAILNLKRYKLPSTDQIPAELIQAGGEILHSGINTLIYSICYKEELPQQWKEPIIRPIYMGDKTTCSTYQGISH
jgi:hypothetical protein